MDYKEKIKIAERIAEQLQKEKTTDQLKSELKAEGFYERDIVEIFVSARNIIGQQYSPKIKQYLVEGKEINGADDFSSLDNDLIRTLIEKESNSLALAEKKKITKLIREGQSEDEILSQVDSRFLPLEIAVAQIVQGKKVKEQNSGGGRMLNILGGIGLIVLTVVIFFAADRLFYFLPLIGLYMIFKGVTTQEMDYDGR